MEALEETELLREYCQQASELLVSDHSATPLVLPLIFTRDQLSVDWHSDNHPFWWGEHPTDFASIAKISCAKNLGLKEIKPDCSDGDSEYEFVWTTE